ncbi:GTP binding protein [Aureococcus anophagefferens]|nr:GTP binding protein [Aureococcus anophagefferens]
MFNTSKLTRRNTQNQLESAGKITVDDNPIVVGMVTKGDCTNAAEGEAPVPYHGSAIFGFIARRSTKNAHAVEWPEGTIQQHPEEHVTGGEITRRRSGDGRVALIGFPSVGKSSLLSTLTSTQSEAAGYEFTTLTCIPGNILYNDTKIQLLDLPGIIEGAAHGKGRGKEVIAVARTSDLVLIVLDAGKEGVDDHKGILERELETVGLRLNKTPPNIALVKKATGGVKFNATVPLTKLGDDPAKTVNSILHEFRLHNCEVLFRGDYGTDELIDVINGTASTCGASSTTRST